MQLLPVIDLKGGMVVRAIAGRRHEYQPISSRLAKDPLHASIASAFVEAGFKDAYVADLDAIAGGEPDWTSYAQIGEAGLRLLIDAGVSTIDRAKRLIDYASQSQQIAAFVIGSESIGDTVSLQTSLKIFGEDRAVFSLDMQEARPIVVRQEWRTASPLEIIADVVAVGYRRIIVLDLVAVGSVEGPVTAELCRQIRSEFSELEIISGGGIRDRRDVERLCEAGCDRVLVASALHDGKL